MVNQSGISLKFDCVRTGSHKRDIRNTDGTRNNLSIVPSLSFIPSSHPTSGCDPRSLFTSGQESRSRVNRSRHVGEKGNSSSSPQPIRQYTYSTGVSVTLPKSTSWNFTRTFFPKNRKKKRNRNKVLT